MEDSKMELKDIKQNSLVVEFEYVGNDWDRYAFITQCNSPEKLFDMFLEWCSNKNEAIKNDMEESNIREIFHNTFVELQYRLIGVDEWHEICEIPLIVGDNFYVATMNQENEYIPTDRNTKHLSGSLSVRKRHYGGVVHLYHDETIYKFRAYDVGTLLGLDDNDLEDDE